MSDAGDSDLAAAKALKRITTMDVLHQLNLTETVVCLYSSEGLTTLELERLNNYHNTEIERKNYLLTSVIPSKGPYKGMQLLQKALQQTGQHEILNRLNKAYEDAVNALIAENLRTSSDTVQTSACAINNGRSDSISSSITSISEPDLVEGLDRFGSSSSQSGSDDGGDPDPSGPQQLHQQQPPLSPAHIIIHLPLSQSTTVSVTPHGYRERSGHISYLKSPYKPHPKCHREHSVELTLSTIPQDDTAGHNGDANTEMVSH